MYDAADRLSARPLVSSSACASSLGARHRRAAREALADVGGGAAVDGRAALEQRDAVCARAVRRPASTVRGRRRRAERPLEPPRSGPTSATSRAGPRWRSIACSGGRTPCGWRGAISCTRRRCAERRAPRSAPRRSAREPQQPERAPPSRPTGIGVSSRSLRRATAARGRRTVEKNPPFSSSAKRASDRVGERARRDEPARLERRLVEREQRLEQERVVLEVRVQLRARRG